MDLSEPPEGHVELNCRGWEELGKAGAGDYPPELQGEGLRAVCMALRRRWSLLALLGQWWRDRFWFAS